MNKIDQKATELYDIYTAAVGGKAWDGKPLPCGKDFMSDPTKQTQANGWRAVAAHILTPSNSPIARHAKASAEAGHSISAFSCAILSSASFAIFIWSAYSQSGLFLLALKYAFPISS